MADAICALDRDFDVYGSSSHMFTDWRWYKDIHGRSQSFNKIALNIFWQNIHNLIDYRYFLKPVDKETGVQVMDICNSVFEISILVQNSGIQKSYLENIQEQLQKMYHITSGFSVDTASAIKEFEEKVLQFLSGHKVDFNNMTLFAPWFGRGQQYLSFIRKSQYALTKVG